ncbi:MAG: SDR family NAD(P)-dependent oxidoreductase, partial [Candidatus Latescibacteria bacterium]|nr:SDR family NAD(P)-dependent oxidoreductase [Candidatus Latescibacterota bacterium]
LPSYPWHRESYFFESEASRADRLGGQDHPMLGNRLRTAGQVWESEVNDPYFPYLKDHCIDGATVFPGSAYVEIGLALDRALMGDRNTILEEVTFHRALILDAENNYVLQIEVDEHDHSFSISGTPEGDRASWTVHATGNIVQGMIGEKTDVIDLDAIRERCLEPLDTEVQYRELENRGHEYGQEFRRAKQIWKGENEAFVEIDNTGFEDVYRLHPALLDTAFQALIAPLDKRKMLDVYLPVSIERVQFYGSPKTSVWTHAVVTSHTADFVTGDIVLCDENGTVSALIKGLSYQALPSARNMFTERIEQSLYGFTWEATDLASLIGEADDDGAGIERVTPGAWLIVGGDASASDIVSRALTAGGATSIRVSRGERFAEVAPDHYHVGLDNTADFGRIAEMIGPDNLRGCVYLGALESESSQWHDSVQCCIELKDIVVSLAAGGVSLSLAIVTRSALCVDQEQNTNVMSSVLWGLGRVIMTEHPELRCCLVDIDGQAPNEDEWMAVLVGNHGEEEIVFRRGLPFVHRFSRIRFDQQVEEERPSSNGSVPDVPVVSLDQAAQATTNGKASGNGHATPPAVTPVELEIGQAGVIDSLEFREVRRQPPGSGEVEIRVHAVALNFKDVMKVMGLISETILKGTFFGDTLGMECSGTVCSVGPDVDNFRIGDEVVVAAGVGCFRSFVTLSVNDAFIVKKPANMTMDEAPIIVPYLTAFYSLNNVARLQSGERVLIHAGTGGVGLAAVHYAQSVGAEIFATAGSPSKRDYLKSMGVPHVMDSRSLDFADEILAVTDGQGVDVVLNSLFGEALVKSFEVLAPYGRFIEIGKRDIDDNNGLPMRAFNRNLTFAAVDLDRIVIERRDLAVGLLESVYDNWVSGEFKPLPTTTFPANEVADAFRYMGQAKHIGKVIVSMDEPVVAAAPLEESGINIKSDGTYLVTGGLGGFGLSTAQWLIDQGARHLVLAGRTGAGTEDARSAVATMQSAGNDVHVSKLDVADTEQVSEIVAEISRTMPPLRGVIHGAGVLSDGTLTTLNADDFERVMAPKVAGAWNLHQATKHLDLDYFILYSSVSALIGNAGQGNYAAANAFLDGLAHYRRSMDLPAISVNWGALKEVGMAARDPAVLEFLERIGVRGFTPAQALEGLNRVLARNPVQIGIVDLDWARMAEVQSSLSKSPRFRHLISAAHSGFADDRVTQLLATLSRLEEPDRMLILQNLVAKQVARVLRLPVAKVDLHQSLMDMGMDSLTGFELLTVIRTVLGVEISPMELMRGVSVIQLSRSLHDKLVLVEPENDSDGDPQTPDDVEALLTSMMPASVNG